jgi:hypothetical protein
VGSVGFSPVGVAVLPRPTVSAHPTIVLQVEDECIVELALRLQFRHDPPNPLIHAINHRRIHFHAAFFERLIFHRAPITHCGCQLHEVWKLRNTVLQEAGQWRNEAS